MMVATKLTYSDLRYWYLSEIRRIKKTQYGDRAARDALELKALRYSLAELRLARRGREQTSHFSLTPGL